MRLQENSGLKTKQAASKAAFRRMGVVTKIARSPSFRPFEYNHEHTGLTEFSLMDLVQGGTPPPQWRKQ